MKIPKELAKHFGVKITEMLFTKSQRVIIRYEDEWSNDEIRENVFSINLVDGPTGATIDVNYKTDDGEGAIASAVKNIKEIIVSD